MIAVEGYCCTYLITLNDTHTLFLSLSLSLSLVRTSLGEGSARHRNLYLAIPSNQRRYTNALDPKATRIQAKVKQ